MKAFGTIMIMLVCVFSQAQDNAQRRILPAVDGNVKCYVLEEAVDYKVNEKIIYHWLKGSELHQSQGDFHGRLLHGEYIKTDLEGNLRIKGEFHRGRKNGFWKFWNDEGMLIRTEDWCKGFMDGEVRSFDENGLVKEVQAFRRGVKYEKRSKRLMRKSQQESKKQEEAPVIDPNEAKKIVFEEKDVKPKTEEQADPVNEKKRKK